MNYELCSHVIEISLLVWLLSNQSQSSGSAGNVQGGCPTRYVPSLMS